MCTMKQYGIWTHACSKNKHVCACALTQWHDFWISIPISHCLRSFHTVMLHAHSAVVRGLLALKFPIARYRPWMSIIEDDVVERPLNSTEGNTLSQFWDQEDRIKRHLHCSKTSSHQCVLDTAEQCVINVWK